MILVTGGAGYIGSHTCVELLKCGYEIVVVDNFDNSKPKALDMIRKITGKDFRFYEASICDKDAMTRIFSENNITEVIHFAGLKAVAESVRVPLKYYRNNVFGSTVLLEAMAQFGCKKMVFSSSATVYGFPKTVPVTEEAELCAINPYGQTKLIIENMCRDLYTADDSFEFALLRYFNPVGAHESGLLGEDPNGIPNNLMPIILNVATGKTAELSVFGNDYPTPDGTCVRDYIHVVDLAKGHIAALKAMKPGAIAYNLGTGNGYSVLEILETFKRVNSAALPYKFADRRPGDAAQCYSDPSKAKRELGWAAEFGVDKMCEDSWRFAVSQSE
jgi:UDP-glucose 4-epimerase